MQLFFTYLLSLFPFFEKPVLEKPSLETVVLDSCGGTYMRVFGDPGISEFTHAFLNTPDGNLLIGGSRGGASLLMLVTPGGEVLWSKTLDFTSGTDFIFDMMLDSEGMLLASGRDELNSPNNSYYFKYNLQSHTVIWAKDFPFSFARLETFLEKTPGGNYYLLGMVDDNNMFMELDRTTGNVVTMRPYDFGQTDFFLTGKVHNGAIFTAGVQRNGELSAIRASMTKLSLTGDQLWTRFYFNGLSELARTYFYENLIQNDTIVAYGRGDLNGDSFTEGEILLMKANLDGDFLWAKRYNIPSSSSEFGGSFLPLPDGYILQGNHLLNSTGESENFIIRVDKQGNLVWAKTINSISNWGKYAVYLNGFIYFTGRTNVLDPDGDVLLGKMSLDGQLAGEDCIFASDLEVTVNTVTNDYDGQHPLTEFSTSYNPSNSSTGPGNVQLGEAFLPNCECEEVDTCANGLPIHTTPDAVMQSISGECIGGSVVITTFICNADSVATPAGMPISFYLGNPTTTAASLLATETILIPLPPGGCFEFSGTVPVPPNQPIFAVVNDDGTTPTPFNLASGFPNTPTQECDFTNNIGSFGVSYTPPTLDLGPDVDGGCSFQPTLLDAGSGFASYLWSDGSTAQTLTAQQPGTYAVTATDECGASQTDDITLTTLAGPTVDIGYESVEVCLGDSFSFSLGSFASYQWGPASLVDCPTCPNVTTIPLTSDACLTVTATDANGCTSADSICIGVVTDTAFVSQNLQICEGDTIVFFGENLTQSGQYQNIEPNGTCVDVTSLTLTFFEKTVVSFTTETACPFLFDGSVTAIPIGGTPPYAYAWEGNSVFTNQLAGLDVGTYAVTVTDANGCAVVDSVELTAAMRPLVSSEATDASCFGENDGAVAFLTDDPNLLFSFLGSPPGSQASYDSLFSGGYQYFVVDTFGCTWVSFFLIDAPDKIKIELASSIEAAPCDSVQIEASTNASPVTYAWSPPDHLSCTSCPAPVASPFTNTIYHLTVADANGCSASDSIRVRVDFSGRAYLPNAFSPNGDGINDEFYVQGHCLEEVRLLRIFDRWGEKVFEKRNTPPNEPLHGWNGKFRSKDMDPAVFVYYIIVTLQDGTEKVYEGDLTLLR